MKFSPKLSAALIAATLASSAAFAHETAVQVDHPFARATVPQQKASGAFLTLTANHDAKLVSASAPIADHVEIHEMKMEGDVMKMRQIPAIDLPADKAVQLAPGGYHLMLMGLKQQLKAGDTIPLTLTVDFGDGTPKEIKTDAPVQPLGGTAPGHSGAMKMNGDNAHTGHGK